MNKLQEQMKKALEADEMSLMSENSAAEICAMVANKALSATYNNSEWVSVGRLIAMLPEKTYNCEPFGIKMMPCNENEWSVCYYTHFSRKHDDRMGIHIAPTLLEALQSMFDWFTENMPNALPSPPNSK